MTIQRVVSCSRGLLLCAAVWFATGCSTVDLSEAPKPGAPLAAGQGFGAMQRFIGQQFVSGDTLLELRAEDQGQTLFVRYGGWEYKLRQTGKPGRLLNLGHADTKAYLGDDGSLIIEGSTKLVFGVNAQQLPRVDFYNSDLGMFWDSYEFKRRSDFVVRTAANERIERERKLVQDQQQREAAREERQASLASARAWAGALGAISASLPPAAPPPARATIQSQPQRVNPQPQPRPATSSAAQPTAVAVPTERQSPAGSGSGSGAGQVAERPTPGAQAPQAQADTASQRNAAEQQRRAAADAAAKTEAQRQQLAKAGAAEQAERNAAAGWDRIAQRHGTLGAAAAPAAADSPGKAGAWCTKTKNGEFRCMGPAYKNTGSWAQLEAALRMAGCPAGRGYTPVVGSGQYFDCGRALSRNEIVMPTYDPYAGGN